MSLLRENEVEIQGPMERVRRRLLSDGVRRPAALPMWRRSITVPLPVAAAALVVVLGLAVSLTVFAFRPRIGMVRITKAPAGGTEIQIAAPLGNLEALLKSIDTQGSGQADVFTLPSRLRVQSVGEPFMGTESDLKKKTW